MSTASAPSPTTSHPTLALLVDRDADTRRMYSEFLRHSSCEIEEAADGREALAKAIARCPDVIVTETRLPGMSGYDLCQLLRDDAGTRATAIIFVTGDAYDRDVKRAERAGADAVLVKPCLPDQLFSTMQRLLAQSADLRQRSRRVLQKGAEQMEIASELRTLSKEMRRRSMLSRAHLRHDTTTPPTAPPSLVCPSCDHTLKYQRSHVGGVSERHPEQWDYFECPAGCGTFQYRQRTHKLRRVS